jgi:8-oxo-dGTP pyrophosphatase MutT (NUDIX family)
VAAKAIIVRDGRLLVTRNVDALGEWYLLPGGGQEPGEALPETVRRECREEVGADVEVGALRFVRDYIGRHHEFAAEDGEVHQLELMFACALPPEAEPHNGPVPDSAQVGVAWLELGDLERHRLYPQALKRALAAPPGAAPVYLGDVN